jgi:hypothetical protein
MLSHAGGGTVSTFPFIGTAANGRNECGNQAGENSPDPLKVNGNILALQDCSGY